MNIHFINQINRFCLFWIIQSHWFPKCIQVRLPIGFNSEFKSIWIELGMFHLRCNFAWQWKTQTEECLRCGVWPIHVKYISRGNDTIQRFFSGFYELLTSRSVKINLFLIFLWYSKVQILRSFWTNLIFCSKYNIRKKQNFSFLAQFYPVLREIRFSHK